jgi:hypothetical protein
LVEEDDAMDELGRTFPRELTIEERVLTQWLLRNGHCQEEPFLEQLGRAKVAGACGCGCASIAFEIEGEGVPPDAGMEILGDFIYGDAGTLCGVFVFARGGTLAALEVYSLAGESAPNTLPDSSVLRPVETEMEKIERGHAGDT